MSTLTRKQRAVRERTELILRESRRLLLERGYLGLTMDRIAAATEYSKGTIYQHFPNKEEIVAALTIQTARQRVEFFERGATFSGCSRERMSGVGVAAELFLRLYPDHFKAEQVTRAASIRDKISAARASEMRLLEHRCVGVATGVVRDAIAQGELELAEGVRPETVSFGLWCLTYGVFTVLVTEGLPLEEMGFPEPLRLLNHNQNQLLDGYGWAPLSTTYDVAALRERILREVFPREASEGGLL